MHRFDGPGRSAAPAHKRRACRPAPSVRFTARPNDECIAEQTHRQEVPDHRQPQSAAGCDGQRSRQTAGSNHIGQCSKHRRSPETGEDGKQTVGNRVRNLQGWPASTVPQSHSDRKPAPAERGNQRPQNRNANLPAYIPPCHQIGDPAAEQSPKIAPAPPSMNPMMAPASLS